MKAPNSKLATVAIAIGIVSLLCFSLFRNSKKEGRPNALSTPQAKESYELGIEYLASHFDSINLSCKTTYGKSKCPLDKTGFAFISYFILEALPDDLVKRHRNFFLAKLKREMKADGWGYSENSPADSDDSAFAIKSLHLLGAQAPCAIIDNFYVQAERAYKTFHFNTPTSLQNVQNSAFDLNIHPEVNFNIFSLDNICRLKNPPSIAAQGFASLQDASGLWPAYYYVNELYGTFIGLNYFCHHRAGFETHIEEALKRLHSIVGKYRDQDLLTLALALSSLQECGEKIAPEAIEFLLTQQGKDGAWSSPNHQGIWQYYTFDREGPGYSVWLADDSEGLWTTSLILKILKAL